MVGVAVEGAAVGLFDGAAVVGRKDGENVGEIVGVEVLGDRVGMITGRLVVVGLEVLW
jgi:hypothetical protein